MFRVRVRPRIGRRTRLWATSKGTVGISRRGRRSYGWASTRGVGVGGRVAKGLFDWIWRS